MLNFKMMMKSPALSEMTSSRILNQLERTFSVSMMKYLFMDIILCTVQETKSELNHQGKNAVEKWCRKRNLGTISSNIVIFTFDWRKIQDNYFHAEN